MSLEEKKRIQGGRRCDKEGGWKDVAAIQGCQEPPVTGRAG